MTPFFTLVFTEYIQCVCSKLDIVSDKYTQKWAFIYAYRTSQFRSEEKTDTF